MSDLFDRRGPHFVKKYVARETLIKAVFSEICVVSLHKTASQISGWRN